MINLDGKLEKILGELREAVSSIKGVQGLDEELNITYILKVEKEEDKANVEAVGQVLSSQAGRFGFELELLPFTDGEIELAKAKMEAHMDGESGKQVLVS